MERLQGVKHHANVVEDEADDDDELLRDEFSLNKMLVIVTLPGKVGFIGRVVMFNFIMYHNINGFRDFYQTWTWMIL